MAHRRPHKQKPATTTPMPPSARTSDDGVELAVHVARTSEIEGKPCPGLDPTARCDNETTSEDGRAIGTVVGSCGAVTADGGSRGDVKGGSATCSTRTSSSASVPSCSFFVGVASFTTSLCTSPPCISALCSGNGKGGSGNDTGIDGDSSVCAGNISGGGG